MHELWDHSISIYHYQIFMDYIKPISDFLISLLKNSSQILEILSIFETRTHDAQIGQKHYREGNYRSVILLTYIIKC